VVSDSDKIPAGQFEVGFIPIEDVLATFVFSEQDLRIEKAYLEVVSITFENCNASHIIKNLALKTTFLISQRANHGGGATLSTKPRWHFPLKDPIIPAILHASPTKQSAPSWQLTVSSHG
jgi:hypothetical protein